MVKKITREQLNVLIQVLDEVDSKGDDYPPMIILRKNNQDWFNQLPTPIKDRLMAFELIEGRAV